MNNLRTDLKELQKFAITLFFALGILGALILWRKGGIGFLFWGIAALFLLVGLIRPVLLGSTYRGWMTMAMWMGFVMTHFILALMYYLVFTPVGVVMWLLGKDPLKIKFRKDANSYWIKRQQTELQRETYEKMY
jgi:hypothetical protein